MSKSDDRPRVTSVQQNAVAVVRFGNPPSGLVSVKGAALIADAIETALNTPDVRGVVLTGDQPGVFIRHADVSQIARSADAVADGRVQPSSFVGTPFWRVGELLDGAKKPVVAAVNGICMGGGLEIALGCTMRVAGADVALIGLPEIRIDIYPGAGGFQRLARIIGPHQARLFTLKGTTVTAKEAFALGIIDELASDPLARAIELVEGFAQRAPEALAAILGLMRDPEESRQIASDMAAFGKMVGSVPAIRTRLKSFVTNNEQLDLLD